MGIPRRRTRPDFTGSHGGNIAIAVEAKGRSLSYDGTLVARAKKQVGSLPDIRRHPITATYAHVAYFDHDRWCAHLADPPAQSRTGLIDPVQLTAVYYIPIVNAIRARRERELIRLSQTEGSYIRAYFAEVDLYLSVLADIEAVTPTDDIEGSRDADDFTGGLLYERVLRLDEETERFYRTTPQDDREFLGSDGVAVQLGPSWTGVAASPSLGPGDTVA